MVTIERIHYQSPIGAVEIAGTTKGVRSIQFIEEESASPVSPNQSAKHLQDCYAQLEAYFSGDIQAFHSFGLAMISTDFQQLVWEAAMEIPYGVTATYGEIAKSIGDEKAARAVGNALNKNPLLLVVPCHRIVPSSGDIGGFGCGSWRKKWLLEHEQSA